MLKGGYGTGLVANQGRESRRVQLRMGCPCQFNALPTHGRCEGFVAVRVVEGHFDKLRLDGVRFVLAFAFPGAMHEGNGTLQLILDEQPR
jgi:hypothetical protein